MSDAFAAELENHVSRMYRVALRIVGDQDEALDIVQEACVKALRSASGFDGRAAPATWLHRITVNCARDHLRLERRSNRRDVDLDGELTGAVAAMDASPSIQAERLELYRTASGWVNALPEDVRTSFALTQLDGYSYDETSAIQGLPRGTIASRVNRARRILLAQMEEQTDGRST